MLIPASFAKDDTQLHCVLLSMSDINAGNSRGGSAVPWGTQLLTMEAVSFFQLTVILWDLFVRRLYIQLPDVPFIPFVRSPCAINPWSHLSKAFAKSV